MKVWYTFESPLVGLALPVSAAYVPLCGAEPVTDVVPEWLQPVRSPVSKPPLVMAAIGAPGTVSASRSGAYAVGLPNVMVFAPAARVRLRVTMPGVPKLPVGVNVRVCAGPPLTLTCACRPVVDPSQYATTTAYEPGVATEMLLYVNVEPVPTQPTFALPEQAAQLVACAFPVTVLASDSASYVPPLVPPSAAS